MSIPPRKSPQGSTATHYHHQTICNNPLQSREISQPYLLPSSNHPHRSTNTQKNFTMTHIHPLPLSNYPQQPATTQKISQHSPTIHYHHQTIHNNPIPPKEAHNEPQLPPTAIKPSKTTHQHPKIFHNISQPSTTTIKIFIMIQHHWKKSHINSQPPSTTIK